MRSSTLVAGSAIAMLAGTALADITVTQTFSQAADYGNAMTFDEPDVPVGVGMDPWTYYQSTHGATFTSGNGDMGANDFDTLLGIDGGEGDGNQLAGGFGVTMWFDQDITALSWQGWADGSPNPPFGGIAIFLYDDGDQVGFYSGTAPYGGVGDEWFHAVATDGMKFDQVVFFNGAFNSFYSFVDNISFSPVPAPGAIALLGLAGLVGRRRRG